MGPSYSNIFLNFFQQYIFNSQQVLNKNLIAYICHVVITKKAEILNSEYARGEI